MPKIQGHKGRFSIAIPVVLMREQKWKKGDMIGFREIIVMQRKFITIRKVKK